MGLGELKLLTNETDSSKPIAFTVNFSPSLYNVTIPINDVILEFHIANQSKVCNNVNIYKNVHK